MSDQYQPDEQQAVIEAVEVAASRGLPLAAEIAPRPSTPASSAPRDSGMPRPSPWNQLPPDALEKANSRDIMRSLDGIAPRMAAVEAEIEKLITTPVKLIADIASHTLSAGGKRLRP